MKIREKSGATLFMQAGGVALDLKFLLRGFELRAWQLEEFFATSFQRFMYVTANPENIMFCFIAEYVCTG